MTCQLKHQNIQTHLVNVKLLNTKHTNCELSADLFEDIRAYCFLDKRAVVSVAIDHVATHPYVRSDNIVYRTHSLFETLRFGNYGFSIYFLFLPERLFYQL